MQKHKFGQIHHVDQSSFEDFLLTYTPVFFLNTGRSGSAFLENAFKSIDGVDANHEAHPNLMMFPNFALHHQNEAIILKKVFEAARMELILDSFVKEKLFIETNHCLVFFIHQIKALFPKARFVHLLRHPGNFIRSAVMKGWHRNDSIWENNRIRMKDDQEWKQLTQIEKLAWTWNSTHNFIDDFKSTYGEDVMTLKLEELISSQQAFTQMIKFLGCEIQFNDEMIERLQNEKVNEIFISDSEPSTMFKLADYPKYNGWNPKDKEQVVNYCGNLASKYNYQL